MPKTDLTENETKKVAGGRDRTASYGKNNKKRDQSVLDSQKKDQSILNNKKKDASTF